MKRKTRRKSKKGHEERGLKSGEEKEIDNLGDGIKRERGGSVKGGEGRGEGSYPHRLNPCIGLMFCLRVHGA